MAENIDEKYMLGISKDAKAIFKAVLKELNLNENIKVKLDFAVLSIFSQACIDYAKFNEKLQSDSLSPTEYYNLYNNRQLAKKDIMSSGEFSAKIATLSGGFFLKISSARLARSNRSAYDSLKSVPTRAGRSKYFRRDIFIYRFREIRSARLFRRSTARSCRTLWLRAPFA